MINSLLSLSIFLSLLSLLSLPTSMAARHTTDANLIQQTCKITPYYDLCISTLNSDPHSAKADVYGLALIIVEVIKSKTVVAIDQIKKFRASNPRLRKPLNECYSMYNSVLVGDIPEAEQALKFGNPKFAETGMNDAAAVPTRCQEEFAGVKSPLTEINTAVNHLALVVVPIIRSLL